MYVRGAPLAHGHADEIREELRVKEVEFDTGPEPSLRLKPNLPVLGPRLGSKLREVKAALEAGEFEELGEGHYRAAGEDLGTDDVLRSWHLELSDHVSVAVGTINVTLDTTLDPELELEGRVLDLIHRINMMRKQEGYELTDRIVVTLPDSDADVLRHEEWIKQETLAVRIETDSVEAPRIAKA